MMCAGKAQTLSAKLGQLQALTKKIFPHGDLPSFWRKCAVFVTNGTSEPKGVSRCWDSLHPFLQPQPTVRLRDLFSYEWDEIYHAPTVRNK
jgi:hypothetical protein